LISRKFEEQKITMKSISPTGEEFELPTREDFQAEFSRLEKLVAEQRKAGKI